MTMLLIITGAVFLGGAYFFSDRQKSAGKTEDELLVVTSFYPMYIAALNVTDHVEGIRLQNLSEPKTGCLHDYQLTPEDMILLSKADVFIINGGGIEGFISDIASEYPDLYIIDASAGIELLSEEEEHEHEHELEDEEEHHHDHGVNSHIWMSVPRYREQVKNITEGIEKVLPEAAAGLRENEKEYDEKLEELQVMEEEMKEIYGGTEAVIFHEAYEYLLNDLSMDTVYCMDLDEERQVSAGEVAEVVNEMQEHNVHLIFAEETYGKDMGEVIGKETGAGVYYLNTLVRSEKGYDKDSYIGGMSSNLTIIKNALGTPEE